MLRGLYTSTSGMQAQLHRMNALANNIANVDVTGYKRDVSVHKAFPELLMRRMSDDGVYHFPLGSVDVAPIVGKLGLGVEQNETYTVFQQGALKATDNPFDLALETEGFFSIQTNTGERYTRDGSFVLGKEGLLLTKEGYPVVGEGGVIRLKKNNFIVDGQGRIFQNKRLADDPDRLISLEENAWEDAELVDTLKLVQFRRPRYLRKQGGSLWRATETSGEGKILEHRRVKQRFLEGSNVNPVTEMVNMIEVNRSYEANQKVLTSQDSLLGRLVNTVMKF